MTTSPNAYGNIRDRELYMASLWDWSFFDGCFGNTRIRVTDIDGFVERNSKFLFIETKRPGVLSLPRGQMMAYDRLVKRGGATFFIVWGLPGEPEMVQVVTPYGEPLDPQVCNKQQLRWLAATWYRKANSGEPIRREDFRLAGAA